MHLTKPVGNLFKCIGAGVGSILNIQMVEHKLEREVHDHLNSGDIPYETHLLISGRQSGEDLVKFAEQNKIDEIVIGIRRRSKAGKLLFGSTGQYVILNAHCPLVSIK